MRKIPTVFLRDIETFKVTSAVHPECQWVLDGEGVATFKWDGTAVLIDAGGMFARREVKVGKTVPGEFIPVGESNGKTQGWVRCHRDDPQWKYHYEAFDRLYDELLMVGFNDAALYGTYELVGPKINGNRHDFMEHHLIRHGDRELFLFRDDWRTYEQMREWALRAAERPSTEGIVFHHEDGRMAKIKVTDFV